MTTATIRKRSKDESPISDSCNTPSWLNDRLGRFDIDPASNLRSTVHAAWSYALEKGLDGTKLPWVGRGFLNWPYSDPEPFAIKAIEELRAWRCTELVVLCKTDPSTDWWALITQPIQFEGVDFELYPERWDFNERLQFDEPEELVAMRLKKRADAIALVESKPCPRDACFGRTGNMTRTSDGRTSYGPCATRNGTPHRERILAAGLKSIPSETTSNNFCSSIIHHRGLAPKLNLEDVATRWVRPVEERAIDYLKITGAVREIHGHASG